MYCGHKQGFTSSTLQDPQNLSNAVFERIAYKASLPQETHFYDLRHSCVTLLLAHGTDATTVSDLLCHSTVAIMLNT